MAVLALLVIAVIYGIYIVYKSSKDEGFLLKISSVQDQKYPELEEHYNKIKAHMEELDFVYAEQKKFRENHSMHEIPEIRDTIGRIEKKVDKMSDAQISQGLDIARLKALSEK